MAFKTHISNATGNQPGQVTSDMTAMLSAGVANKQRTDFKPTGTAGLSVNIAKGEAFVQNDAYVYGTMDQKFFTVSSDATVAATITANASGNPRIDIICIQVDPNATPGVQGVNSASIVVTAGTPAATPAIPATPQYSLKLCEVAVANGASVISNNEITDTRPQAFFFNNNTPEGHMQNGQINRVISSNALVVSILDKVGKAPTTSSVVGVTINNQSRFLSTPLGVTISAGVNTANLANTPRVGLEHDQFAYLFYKASDDSLVLGVSPVPYGRKYSDFSSSATMGNYIAVSATPASTDQCVNIGRFNAILGTSSSFNWSLPGTANIVNEPIYESRLLPMNYNFMVTTGSAATFTAEFINMYQVQGRKVNLSMTGFNSAGGTPGTGSVAILYELPLDFSTNTVSTTRGDLVIGAGQFTGTASGMCTVVKSNESPGNLRSVRFFSMSSGSLISAFTLSSTTRVLSFTAEYYMIGA